MDAADQFDSLKDDLTIDGLPSGAKVLEKVKERARHIGLSDHALDGCTDCGDMVGDGIELSSEAADENALELLSTREMQISNPRKSYDQTVATELGITYVRLDARNTKVMTTLGITLRPHLAARILRIRSSKPQSPKVTCKDRLLIRMMVIWLTVVELPGRRAPLRIIALWSVSPRGNPLPLPSTRCCPIVTQLLPYSRSLDSHRRRSNSYALRRSRKSKSFVLRRTKL
mmetsp:Transcript_33477/g.39327  ORF Transcript_33477/g.39327 Transcript_33477/m.39327 type:complete len:229 (-) Transcript_33477:2843-3529(-)